MTSYYGDPFVDPGCEEVEVNLRRERIERMLQELQYEITRGMMEGEIDETLTLAFYVPISKSIPDGVVHCRFETRPIPRHYMDMRSLEPRLKLVK